MRVEKAIAKSEDIKIGKTFVLTIQEIDVFAMIWQMVDYDIDNDGEIIESALKIGLRIHN